MNDREKIFDAELLSGAAAGKDNTPEAEALLARLTALETETPPLDAEQAQSLYRRALQKAGLTQDTPEHTASVAGIVDGEAPAGDMPDGSVRAPKAKPLYWRRWVLSAAAALAVMALGGVALVRGGFGVRMESTANDTAMPQYTTEAAMDADDAPAEYSYSLTDAMLDELPCEEAEPEAAQEEPSAGAEEAYSSTGTGANTGTDQKKLAESTAESASDSAQSSTELPQESGDARDDSYDDAGLPLPDAESGLTAVPQLLMADGALYRGTGKALDAPMDESTVLGCIHAVIAAGEVPAADGQANFAAENAPYAPYNGGLAVLLDGEWYYFEPVE